VTVPPLYGRALEAASCPRGCRVVVCLADVDNLYPLTIRPSSHTIIMSDPDTLRAQLEQKRRRQEEERRRCAAEEEERKRQEDADRAELARLTRELQEAEEAAAEKERSLRMEAEKRRLAEQAEALRKTEAKQREMTSAQAGGPIGK
jgi:hypothetical protein